MKGNTMSDFWNDADFNTASDYFKFTDPGDSISGKVVRLSKTTFPGDSQAQPQVTLETADGGEITVTAGQVQLKQKLAELAPVVGDSLTMTFTEVERRNGGKTLKHFDVSKEAAGQAAPAAEPASAAAPAEDALAGLDEQQVAALKAMGKI